MEWVDRRRGPKSTPHTMRRKDHIKSVSRGEKSILGGENI